MHVVIAEDNLMFLTYGLGTYLLISMILDVWKKRISLITTIAFFLLGISYQLYLTTDPTELMISVIPGVCLIACSLITEQRVGIGDGLVIMVCGIYLGIGQVILLLTISLFLAAMAGIMAILFKRATTKTELPWVLFVFIVYLGKIIME